MTATQHGGPIAEELRRLDPGTLRDLAAMVERRQAQTGRPNPWLLLDPAAKDEGLAMLCEGRRPSLAWWEAHIPKPPVDRSDWPPPPPVQPGYRTRRWAGWELIAAAVDIQTDGSLDPDSPRDLETARDVLADLAANHGLGELVLADAYVALEDAGG